MKVREIVEKLDDFEKMLGEYEGIIRVSQEKRSYLQDLSPSEKSRKESLRTDLLRKYSYLRSFIGNYSHFFTFQTDLDIFDRETYESLIQDEGLIDFQEVYDDLVKIRGRLDRYDPDTEVDEQGNLIGEEDETRRQEVIPSQDGKRITHHQYYIGRDLIQGDVNISITQIFETLERVVEKEIDEPKKRERVKGMLKKIYDEIKGVGTDIVSKTLGEILKG